MLNSKDINWYRVVVILLWLFVLLLCARLVWYEQWDVIRKQKEQLADLESHIIKLKKKNDQLSNRIISLKHDASETEEAARWHLSLVKPHEKFYELQS